MSRNNAYARGFAKAKYIEISKKKTQTTKKCHQMFLSWRVKYQLKTVLCAQQILSFTVCETDLVDNYHYRKTNTKH